MGRSSSRASTGWAVGTTGNLTSGDTWPSVICPSFKPLSYSGPAGDQLDGDASPPPFAPRGTSADCGLVVPSSPFLRSSSFCLSLRHAWTASTTQREASRRLATAICTSRMLGPWNMRGDVADGDSTDGRGPERWLLLTPKAGVTACIGPLPSFSGLLVLSGGKSRQRTLPRTDSLCWT